MKKQSKTPDGSAEKERLTSEQLEILNNERQKHLKGEGASYTWEEVINRIRKRNPLKKPGNFNTLA